MPDTSPAEAAAAERDANRIIEQQLQTRLADVEQVAKADLLAYFRPMFPPADDQIKDAVEAIPDRGDALMVVLETGGGYMNVVERIARIFRHHYDRVDFVVPSYAMFGWDRPRDGWRFEIRSTWTMRRC